MAENQIEQIKQTSDHIYYTDGSVSNFRASSAFYTGFLKSVRLNNNTTILQAELYAIKMALEHSNNQASHPRRRLPSPRQAGDSGEGCKKPTNIRPAQDGDYIQSRGPIHVPGYSPKHDDGTITNDHKDTANVCIPWHHSANTGILCEGAMEGSPDQDRGVIRTAHPPYTEEGRSIHRI